MEKNKKRWLERLLVVSLSKKTKELFLIEINCRQPASTTMKVNFNFKKKINKLLIS